MIAGFVLMVVGILIAALSDDEGYFPSAGALVGAAMFLIGIGAVAGAIQS